MSRTAVFGRRRRRSRLAVIVALFALAVVGGGAVALVDSEPPATPVTEPTPAPTAAAEDTADAPVEEPTPRPAATPTPEPTEAPTANPDPDPLPRELVEDVTDVLAGDDVTDIANLSALVVDDLGRVVADHQGDVPVMPASTNKLVTAAAALHLLGPEYRYVTRAVATGPIDDGVLDGDLVVVGQGDPTLASPTYVEEVYPARPHTRISALARAVVDAGIEEITGSVLGDPSTFADEPEADGWRDRYFDTLDTTRASGLTVDAGRRLLERDDMVLGMVADDPAEVTAEVLDDLLADADVEIGSEPGRGTAPPTAEEAARVQSPPMIDLLAHVMIRSDNHMADAVFRTLGARTGDATWTGGDVAARAALSDLDVDWSGAVMADGSGLSRDDRLSAEMLISVDRAFSERHGATWRDLMAVMGETGTLSRRLRGTPAEGRVTGKTGSLRDARSLVARADPLDGGPYYFAVLGAQLQGEEIAIVRDLINDLSVRLAEG